MGFCQQQKAMRYRDIKDSFLIQNINTPENILDAFETSAHGTNEMSKLYDACEKIAESENPREVKLSKLSETIKNYHTHLYTK